jgi:hypothetical protein
MQAAGDRDLVARVEAFERAVESRLGSGALDAVDLGALAGWPLDGQPEHREDVAAG